MHEFISQGWTKITVGETTSFDLHPNYVQATRDGLGKVKLGENCIRRITATTHVYKAENLSLDTPEIFVYLASIDSTP